MALSSIFLSSIMFGFSRNAPVRVKDGLAKWRSEFFLVCSLSKILGVAVSTDTLTIRTNAVDFSGI
jgi:hypothetical protein